MAKNNGKGRKAAAKAVPRGAAKPQGSEGRNTLAAIIAPMLLAGKHTVKEIATELAKKAGEAARGKDLQANVRAR